MKSSTNQKPAPDADDGTGVQKHLVVHGKSRGHDGAHVLSVGRPNEALSEAIKIPFRCFGTHGGGQLSDLLMNNGHVAVVTEFGDKEIAAHLRGHAQHCKDWVIDRPGIHQLAFEGRNYTVVVIHGRAFILGVKRRDELVIKLAGEAALVPQAKHDLRHFNKYLAPVFAANPRLLVVLCFALAALVLRLFDRKALGLLLVGKSSQGKSLLQGLVMYLVNGLGEVLPLNATTVGLHDFLADRPDRAVFLEDTHGAEAAQALLGAVMDSANGGQRIRARSTSQAEPSDRVSATLIMSAERGLADTARLAHQPLNAGIYARLFEVGLGEHGVFDDLCDREDGSELARDLIKAGPLYRGVVGGAFVEAIAGDWSRVQKLHGQKLDYVRSRICPEGDENDLDALNGRVLDGLVFAAFAGCLATKLGVLNIKLDAVTSAFRLVFREHLDRLARAATPIAAEAVEAVRHYIQKNPSRFPALARACEPTKPNGLAGYTKDDRDGVRLYHFFPGTFRKEFEDQYGKEVYSLLRDAGFLLAQKGRHNLTSVRLPGGGQRNGQRQDFVVISGAILDSLDEG